jgi:hypothetical protein
MPMTDFNALMILAAVVEAKSVSPLRDSARPVLIKVGHLYPRYGYLRYGIVIPGFAN